MRSIVAFAAGVEAITGLILIVAPDLVVRLLFAAPLTAGGSLVARVAGFSLSALGLACWPKPTRPTIAGVRGLLLYNAFVAIFFAYLAIRGEFIGLLLWPALIVHAGFAALLARFLLSARFR